MRKLFNDEAGFIVSAELVLVLTIAVLGMVVGLTAIRDSIASEMCDLASAFGALDQSFNIPGIAKSRGTAGLFHGQVSGAGYNDAQDICDCQVITYIDVTGKTQTGGGLGESANAVP